MLRIVFWLIWLSVVMTGNSMAIVIDVPHDEAVSGIRCGSCHSYSLWWNYSPAGVASSPSRGQIATTMCLQCHNDPNGPFPYKKPHSSLSFEASAQHADWSTNCTDCHDPHFQAQLDWIGSNSNELYLVTGTIGPAGSFVEHGNGTTTFSYTTTNRDPLWADPLTWTNKTGPGRSLIFVDDIQHAANTYSIVAADDMSITVKGGFKATSAGHSFGLIYGQLIKSSIATPHSGSRAVKFFNPKETFAVGGLTEPSVSAPQGVCQVCHTLTRYWRNDGQHADPATGKFHNPAIVCTACHTIASGFKPSGGPHPFLGETPFCMSCHLSGDILAVHKNDCQKCHTTPPDLADPATKPLVIAIERGACQDCHGAKVHNTETVHDHRKVVASCAACHEVSTAEALDALHKHNCGTCHGYSGTKLNAAIVASTIETGKGDTGTDVNCQSCHIAGAGLHPTDITGIAPWHDQFKADDNCSHCHSIDTAEERLRLHLNCFICHTSSKSAVVAAISAGKNGSEVNCSTCHSGETGSAIVHGVSNDTVAPLHNLFVGDAVCAQCHDIDTAEKRLGLHPGCITCHTSPKSAVVAAISAGKNGSEVKCGTCHSDEAGGAVLHGTVTATVAPLHDFFALDTVCAGCHDIDTAEKRLGLHPNCFTCHTSIKSAVVAAISAGKNGSDVNCSTCHSGEAGSAIVHGTSSVDVAQFHEFFVADSLCVGCHDINTAEKRIGVHPNCLTCHASNKSAVAAAIATGRSGIEVNCGTCHSLETGSAMVHGTTLAAVAPLHEFFVADSVCAGCHDTGTTEQRLGLHPDCLTCHTSIKIAVATAISSGKSGIEVNCGTCHNDETGGAILHGTVTATVAPLHDLFAADSVCAGCHDIDTAEKRLGLHPTCFTCHTSVKSAVVAAISSGKNGTEVNCSTCHSLETGSAIFHGTSLAAIIPLHDFFVEDTDCTGCHDIDTVAKRLMLHPDCLTCHSSAKSAVISAISMGRNSTNVTCSTCHSGETGSAIVHGTTPNVAAPFHDFFVADPVCAECHDIDTAEKRLGVHPDCLTCHTSTKSAVAAAISLGKRGVEVDCGTCHTGETGTANLHGTTTPTVAALHNFFADDTACAGCHDIDTTEKRLDIHPDCLTCHTSPKSAVVAAISAGKSGITVQCRTCHRGEESSSALVHGITAPTVASDHDYFVADPTCLGCHESETAEKRIVLHPNCFTCHKSTSGVVVDVIRLGRNGTSVKCSDCHLGGAGAYSHGTTPATAAAVHNMFKATAKCAGCHSIGSAEQRIALHPSCTICHTSTKAAVVSTVAAGRAGTSVACTDCHQAEVAGVHHVNANAANGNCTWCHADPRPEWSAQSPGDNGGASAVPTQLACAACHVRVNGDTMYIDKLSFASDGSPTTRTVQHTITGVSAGYIYNYGMCFSCHRDGGSAPKVSLWHGKPQIKPGPRFDLMTGAPGKGKFNVFWSEFRLEQEIRGKDYLKKLRQAYLFSMRDELYQLRDFYKSQHTREYMEKRTVLWQRREGIFQKRNQFKAYHIRDVRIHQRDNQYPATGYGYRITIPCGTFNGCTGSSSVPVLSAKPVPQ